MLFCLFIRFGFSFSALGGVCCLALLFGVLSFINPFSFVWPSSFFNFRLDDMSLCYPLSGCNVIHFRDTVLSQPFWFYIITHLSSFSSNFPSPLVLHYLYFTSFTIFIGSYSTSTAHFAPVASGVVDLPHCCSRTKTCSMNENECIPPVAHNVEKKINHLPFKTSFI